MKKRKALLRTIIVALAGLGIWGVVPIAIAHLAGDLFCPMIGPIPACYVVLAGYILIVFSMYPYLKRAKVFFLIGWGLVITIALIGVVGELTAVLQCPYTENGIPKCYFSAALALIIGLSAWFLFKIPGSQCNN